MYKMLKSKIKNKEALVGIVGLGYVGLPIAIELVKKGFSVIGIDLNEERVESLRKGHSYIIDVEDEEVREAIKEKMQVELNYKRIGEVDAILICVPTPLSESKEPDLSYIVKSMDEIIKYMKKETLIVLESTTYPGTTCELITDRVEREKSYRVGEDFFVCYSPERVDPGNTVFGVHNTAKVLGGTTENCLELGQLIYESFLEKVVTVSSTRVAEMSKLLENTFRCVNIALVNELAMMCERMDIDVWEVIKGASSKPFGFMPFYPGPGIGGHCIPLDPLYLAWEGKKHNFFSRFIETASDVNGNMPRYVVAQVQEILNNEGKALNGSRVLILGMAYKKNIDDLRESPALDVYELLLNKGAKVKFYDPYVESFQYEKQNIFRSELTKENLATIDLVLIITDHDEVDYEYIEREAKLIYDTRNVMKKITSEKVITLGNKNSLKKGL